MKLSRLDVRRRIRPGDIFLILVILLIAILGVVLVSTAPLDAAARTNVGGNLITGVVIGVILVLYEKVLDRRKKDRDLAIETTRQYSEARSVLAELVRLHVQNLYMVLQSAQQTELVENLHARSQPSGWQGSDDLRAVLGGLIWREEVMGADPRWWQWPIERERTDALYIVASDLADRLQLDIELAPSFWASRGDMISRIDVLAGRLSDAGNTGGAADLDAQATALQAEDIASYLPKLPDWGDRNHDYIITAGGPFDRSRKEVAWLIDRLRPDAITVDRDGKPRAQVDSSAANYRWKHLISQVDGHNADLTNFFGQKSWFRSLLNLARQENEKIFNLHTQ
jgi:hypothetical protein